MIKSCRISSQHYFIAIYEKDPEKVIALIESSDLSRKTKDALIKKQRSCYEGKI